VAHALAVDDVSHLHARAKFAGLDFDRKDGSVRRLHIVEDGGGHGGERSGLERLQYKRVPLAAGRLEFGGDGCRDLQGGVVGDERNFFGRLDAQARRYGVVRAVGVLQRKGDEAQVEDHIRSSLECGVQRKVGLGIGWRRNRSASFRFRSDGISFSRCLHVVIVRYRAQSAGR
jgi:hypothetical protein